jgi:6-phosphogluconolactonase
MPIKSSLRPTRFLIGLGVLTANSALLAAAPKVVYTSTNAAAKNEVVAYDRAPDGSLSQPRMFATGGVGTGSGLGSQGAIAAVDDWLLVVNAGSNDVTVFSETDRRLVWRSRSPSGGTTPISIAVNDEVVYVLNGGALPNITGFRLGEDGQLTLIPGSQQNLGGAAPAQVAFNKDGSLLAVTEKNSNTIEVFTVDDSVAKHAYTAASSGQTPFGFSFAKKNRMIVSEASGGAAGLTTVSSYSLAEDGAVTSITRALATTQTSACWVMTTRNGKIAFTANTGSGTISSLSIEADGSLKLLAASAGNTGSGSAPADLALSKGDVFLYSLNGGTGTITGFSLQPGGTLRSVSTLSGISQSAAGLAAR